MSGGISAATIATYATAAFGAIGAISTLTAKRGGSTPAPALSAAPTMPLPDDEAAKSAKRRALAGQAQRRGRQSTILSDDSTLSNDLLGG